MKEIENFYKDLYTLNGEIEDDRFANFVQNLDITKLQDLEKEELEGEITLEECKEDLTTFPVENHQVKTVLPGSSIIVSSTY